MFFITLLFVYFVYGYQWTSGDPLRDWKTAKESFYFSVSLMLILLSHEMGHYIVAKRHDFSLSLPYFIPFPFAFGTLGAVISLKSLPKSRNALLEMGAAGPITGFIASFIAIVIGMPYTQNHKQIELPKMEEVAVAATETTEGSDLFSILTWPLEKLFELLVWIGTIPPPVEGGVSVGILADPLLLKIVGYFSLGEPLSPYAVLHPMAFAGWVGCLLTAINMIPIGQLDGGHICQALLPKYASQIAKIVLGSLVLGAIFWPGWFVWALLLFFMGAHRGIPIQHGGLSTRAKIVAFAAVISFIFSFMLRPIMIKNIETSDIKWIEEK
ncbi:MAG: site-2 protease family protein [Myxococcota bacterium]|nr:site-2 protease family protein [Myxococcota bacterium]